MPLIPAHPEDLPEVLALYDAVHTALEQGPNGPGWQRGVYPTHADAQQGLAAQTLYLLRTESGHLAASAIMNHEQPAAYAQAVWQWVAPPERVAVIHTFLTHPGFARQGHATSLLLSLHALAQAQGCRCIRLDTYTHNEPAKALYEKLGYRRAGLVDLGFCDRGLTWYQCYELAL